MIVTCKSFVEIHHFSYGLVFATFFQYIQLVPTSYQIQLLGIPLNDKIFIYLLALQVCSYIVHVHILTLSTFFYSHSTPKNLIL